MKIAYLSTFYPFRGGIAQFNALLYRAFAEKHQINAYTFTRQYPEFLFPGSTQYASETDIADKIPAIPLLDTLNPFSYLTTAHKIAAFAPDILVMKYWMPFFAPALGTVAGKLKKNGTKIITILDNVIPHEKRFYDDTCNRYFLNRNNGFVVMSETVKKDLLSLQPAAKYIFHPHPLYSHFGQKINQSEAKKQLNIPENKKVLLFFGLIRAYKGLDLVIEAFDKLSDEYFLIIAGEPYQDFSVYQALIDKNVNKDRILVHAQYVSDRQVPIFFSAADVNLLPYKSATQSGVVSIAYQFDLPVIVTDVGSLAEMVTPYQAGIVINAPESSLLTDAIQTYFHDKLKANFENNIHHFKKNYNWNNLAESIVTFSNSL